ncbi:hypothetical protein [Methanococcus voltae]|uniref:Peptidase A24B, FlaK domain protein n=1 Tax=Methanococcus voltae (strain ATCC BAA-1334 / A3) TaxID=456320 RepID=D7DTA7_METV3|nr:hypothetical protein [Methanococcus voltae]MCS3901218.1 preflagellin peptidase FlaK [Methanococcus voltae]
MSIEYIYGFFCILAGIYFEFGRKKYYDIFWISMLYLGVMLHFNMYELFGIILLTIANYLKKHTKLIAYIGIIFFVISYLLSGSYYALSLVMYYFIASALYHCNLMEGQETKYLIGIAYLSGFLISSSLFLDSVLFVIPIPIYCLIKNYRNYPSEFEDITLPDFARLATSIKKSEKDVKPNDHVVGYDKKSLIRAGFENNPKNPYLNNNIDISAIGELSNSMKHKLNYNNSSNFDSTLLDKKVWITPHIPFMLFIGFSYIVFWFVRKPLLFVLIDNLVH